MDTKESMLPSLQMQITQNVYQIIYASGQTLRSSATSLIVTRERTGMEKFMLRCRAHRHMEQEIDWGRFFKVKYAESAELGQQVQKVGRETGWTYGTLTNTCQDVFLSDKTAVMCSYKVSGGSQNGDSGAPVFGIIGNPPYYDPAAKSYAIDVNAYGILWGGSTNYFWYSPIGLVSQEVGPVRITK